MILKANRRINPKPTEGIAHTNSRRFTLPDRSHAPRAVASPPPSFRVNRECLAASSQGSIPTTSLRQATSIKNHSPIFANVMSWLFESGHSAGPCCIKGDAPFVISTTHTQFLEWLNHFNTERSDPRVHPISSIKRTRRPYHTMLALMEHQKISVNDS